ncbi:MAG: AAA family ATPase [Desulfobacterales bacterium]|nr:AAA family ATPase [Desulfobacterales bacterium]
MEAINDYQIIEKIADIRGVTYYRGRKTAQSPPVIIEFINVDLASHSKIARLKNEYKKIQKLDRNSVIPVYEVFDYQDGIAIVTEEFTENPLYNRFTPGEMDIDKFLKLAANLSRALGDIHSCGIVHGAITPANILCNNHSDGVKVLGFGATRLISRIHEEIYDPVVIKSVLPYMAPEQTGRMNCSVDHRVDLYAAGIIFYELLTGGLPFSSDDPIEIIHAHIARRPEPPVKRRTDLPQIISDIVMKLISKTVENRYQSGYGLAADFEECARQLKTAGEISPFALARHDIPPGLHIPEKLFGRQSEAKSLMAAFDRAAGGSNEIFLVAGPPGIGKSTLVNEIQKPVVQNRAYFIVGKAERYKRDIPYYPLIQAFQELAAQILCETDAQIEAWKDNIIKAVAPNGRFITNLIPNFERIIGPQPDLSAIGPDITQHRYIYVFKEFIKVCATQEHPLVVFADDLQWADPATLSLIRRLSTEPEIGHLLLIGAYRDNAVKPDHPLIRTMDEAEKNGAAATTIKLPPLSVENINQLIADFLRCVDRDSLELSEIVHKKTSGNPFFIRQFLKTLYDEGTLTLDPTSGWTWNMEKVANIQFTDNVVDFMAAKIARMPVEIRQTLKICACYGNRFDLFAVAANQNTTINETIAALSGAEKEGLIFFKEDTGVFSHDRIREAIYHLFREDERVRTHYRIGRYLLENTSEKQLDEGIIDITNHFNIARKQITSLDQQYQTARLNCRAGQKALASGAFESAFHYFKTGIEFIASDTAHGDANGDCWRIDYNLTLELYSGCAEAAYLIADYDAMYRLTDEIINRAQKPNDAVGAHIVRLQTLMAQNNLDEVIRSGLLVLKSMGISLPKQPGKQHILRELLLTKIQLLGKQPDDILDLPPMTDPTVQAQVEVMATITSTAYWTLPNLLPIIVLRLLRIFAKYGNTGFSPYIYAGYGMILCTLGDIDTGYHYGQAALRLMDRMNNPKYKACTLMVVNTFVRHWKEHAKNVVEPLLEAHQNGLAQGDIEFAGHSLMVRGYTRYLLATPLDDLDRDLEKNRTTLNRIGQVSNLHVASIFHQAVLNLRNKSSETSRLVGKIYNETEMITVHEEANDQTALHHLFFNKVVLNYLFGDYTAAFNASRKMMAFIDGAIGSPLHVPSYFYDTLAHIEYFPHAGWLLKQKILSRIRRNLKKLKKWARQAPSNCLHKYHLVEAELARIKGRYKKAFALYKKAVTGARDNRYLQEQAMACELAARFYHFNDFDDLAASYMAKTHELYTGWGAHAKANDIKEKYEAWFRAKPVIAGIEKLEDEFIASPTDRAVNKLDLAAMMKMSQAISSEIHLDKLLTIFMRLIIEISGAEKALLILNRNDQLRIEATADINKEDILVLQGIDIEQSDALSHGIVSYVKRTNETIVLHNAADTGIFIRDPHVQKQGVQSVFCLPLVRQQKLIGLIYLENNLTPNAFTPSTTEMISLLSTQAANCLENAFFFEETRAAEKRAQRQREQYQKLVETMNDGLTIIDPQLNITYVNKALCLMSGYTADELIGRPAKDFLDEAGREKLEREVATWQQRGRHIFEIDWIVKDAKILSTLVSPTPIYDDSGEFAGFLGIVTDITGVKKAEKEKELAQAQLVQSQKMEAIGTLAGGVAHDFNNYLMTVLGSVDLLRLNKDHPEKTEKHIGDIKNAAELSAALTRQLLAFSRRQMLEKTAIDLNAVVSNMEKMMQRLIGENIEFKTSLDPNLKPVHADFGQMEQIIMNLAVNARDAMPQGGHLKLKTENLFVDEMYCQQYQYAKPGEFTCLTIEDTGAGMNQEQIKKIFDPFFSTKPVGQGTGLGLSVVFGVVKQHSGWINVYSEPDIGTRFSVYLPVAETTSAKADFNEDDITDFSFELYQGSQERILLVEDQLEVREVVVTALEDNGYIVQEAESVEQAKALLKAAEQPFDLLFSDVILPDGNGFDLSTQVAKQYSNIKILLTSGYTEEQSRPDAINQKQFHYIQKPYQLGKMLKIIRQVLSG